MFQDYEELKLELLKFSKNKIIDDYAKDISFFENYRKLFKYKLEQNKNKYIVVLLVSDDKVVKKIDNRLDKFTFKFWKKYFNEKENIRVVVYLFDTDNENAQLENFLGVNSKLTLKSEINYAFDFFKKYITIPSGLLGALIVFFTYLGITEYGIPIDKVQDATSISYLLIAGIGTVVGFFVLIIPIVFYFIFPILVCSFLCNGHLPYWLIVLFIYFLVYNLLGRKYPVIINLINHFLIEITKGAVFSIIALSIITVTLIISQSILSNLVPDNKFYDKSGYRMVLSEYLLHYSGYPKILNKDGKDYYLPVKDNRYYYVYDVNNVKDEYFSWLKKEKHNKKLAEICDNNTTKNKFKEQYILNNPFIKPGYLNKSFKIDDSNISIEAFDMDKLISDKDVENLCDEDNYDSNLK